MHMLFRLTYLCPFLSFSLSLLHLSLSLSFSSSSPSPSSISCKIHRNFILVKMSDCAKVFQSTSLSESPARYTGLSKLLSEVEIRYAVFIKWN